MVMDETSKCGWNFTNLSKRVHSHPRKSDTISRFCSNSVISSTKNKANLSPNIPLKYFVSLLSEILPKKNTTCSHSYYIFSPAIMKLMAKITCYNDVWKNKLFTLHRNCTDLRAYSIHTTNLTVTGFCSENLQTRGCLRPNLHSKPPLKMQWVAKKSILFVYFNDFQWVPKLPL
jgi:hypothetical protein